MSFTDIFYYDVQKYLKLDRFKKLKFTKNFIDSLVSQLHDPLLIIDSMLSDDKFPVCFLYSDGSITRFRRKLMDMDHDNYVSYEIISPSDFFKFPCSENLEEDTYAVMTLEDCCKVKNLINELMLEI